MIRSDLRIHDEAIFGVSRQPNGHENEFDVILTGLEVTQFNAPNKMASRQSSVVIVVAPRQAAVGRLGVLVVILRRLVRRRRLGRRRRGARRWRGGPPRWLRPRLQEGRPTFQALFTFAARLLDLCARGGGGDWASSKIAARLFAAASSIPMNCLIINTSAARR